MRDSHEWQRLFSAALNDTITAGEKAQLAVLLKASAEARQLWFLYHDNECGLAELKPRMAATSEQRQPARAGAFSWSPLTAAAAGLVIGLFSASMVWGYVESFAGRALTLMAESFEAGPVPQVSGMPVNSGVWSGDFSEVVGHFRGVQPLQGAKMLRLRRADYEGKPVRDGWVADLFRIVDVRGAEFGVARNDASLLVEASFSALPQEELRGLSCGVTIYALDALPLEGERDDAFLKLARSALVEGAEVSEAGPRILATGARTETADATGETWQSVRSELRLPAGTRYCLIHLRAHLTGAHRPEIPKPVEFAGLFVDDIRVALTHRAALP